MKFRYPKIIVRNVERKESPLSDVDRILTPEAVATVAAELVAMSMAVEEVEAEDAAAAPAG